MDSDSVSRGFRIKYLDTRELGFMVHTLQITASVWDLVVWSTAKRLLPARSRFRVCASDRSKVDIHRKKAIYIYTFALAMRNLSLTYISPTTFEVSSAWRGLEENT